MGRLMIYIGIALIIFGLVVIVSERAGIRFGRLPGDIIVRGKQSTFYFPIVTCLLLSVLLTLLSWLFRR
jgi:threonine/homoserine/homoserine lactone efflux protein